MRAHTHANIEHRECTHPPKRYFIRSHIYIYIHIKQTYRPSNVCVCVSVRARARAFLFKINIGVFPRRQVHTHYLVQRNSHACTSDILLYIYIYIATQCTRGGLKALEKWKMNDSMINFVFLAWVTGIMCTR
jgi:hypothetical protein